MKVEGVRTLCLKKNKANYANCFEIRVSSCLRLKCCFLLSRGLLHLTACQAPLQEEKYGHVFLLWRHKPNRRLWKKIEGCRNQFKVYGFWVKGVWQDSCEQCKTKRVLCKHTSHLWVYIIYSMCMYVCMYVCMHACMHACMHVCMYVYNYCYYHTMHKLRPWSTVNPKPWIF